MRKRTKISGLISHTTPDGVSYQTSLNKCLVGISRIKKNLNRAYRTLGERTIIDDTGYKTVLFCGKPLKLTLAEYNTYYKSAYEVHID